MRKTLVVVSVDTEEDNWAPARSGVTVNNIRALTHLQSHCDGLGIPVTYFTSYHVAATPWAAGVLRDLHSTGRAEVAGHLHAWNTPPLDESFVPRNTMLKNLPADLQRAKLASLTAEIETRIGVRPTSFRCGRFGLGRDGVRALMDLGYVVDGSVTPWTSWAAMDDGPDFIGAPVAPYTLDGTTEPRDPSPRGPLLEIPVSCGYSRWPFAAWHRVYTALRHRAIRPLRLGGIASRAGLLRAITLSPELCSVSDMLQLARCLVDHDLPVLSLFFHSPTLMPGLSPFARTNADVDRLHADIAAFAEGLAKFTTPVFTTFEDAGRQLRMTSG